MGTKVTYNEIMEGVWGNPARNLPAKSDVGCSPRSGGAKVSLRKINKTDAFKRLVEQQRG